MAAKAGVFDFIFKSGAKAAKEMSKGAGAASKMPKKAAPPKATPPGRVGPNVKVLPGSGSKRGPMGRMDKYMDETGRPAMINARPLAKKATPAKKTLPAKPTAEQFARMGRAEAAAKAARSAQKLGASKPSVPAKKAAPINNAQPYNSKKPAAPAFKEPGGRTNRPTMGTKKYPPTKKPR